ncbi:hypothetical protein [Bacillus cereus]|uniref:hypothetical protein n=1 Tax=Bacillus cereus TaxID=1396 RepID=UPI000BF592EE|nr:hypothetical protein [Bacillus cereus]PFD67328.1 hypothetical protein CN301_28060 [Bacillus cereus]
MTTIPKGPDNPRGLPEYLSFVSDKFPNTIWLQDTYKYELIKLYTYVHENLILVDTFVNFFSDRSLNYKLRFLHEYKEAINSLLITVPVNFSGFARFNIRVASEALLKFIYSLTYTEIEEEQVSRTAFRHLKTELKSHASNLPIKPEIIELTQVYGEYSKKIHNHTNTEYDLGTTLNKFTDDYSEEINHAIRVTDSIINLFTLTVSYKTQFNLAALSSANRIRLNTNISEERKLHLKRFSLNEVETY